MLKQVQVQDGTLQVWDSESSPSDLVILFVHGFPLDHRMWQGQLEAFASSARVIAPDLRGFGGSSESPDVLTMESMADDLVDLLDALNVTSPVVFCGLSMGGYIAWQFWSRHANRLRSLVLCDTRAAADAEQVARGRRYLAQSVLDQGTQQMSLDMTQKLFAAANREAGAAYVERMRQVMLETNPRTVAAALIGMSERPDMTSRLGEIDCPALLICGIEDAITPPEEMSTIAQRMPKAAFVQIKDAGHMAPLEQPKATNEAIYRFLRLSPSPKV